jgi:hypothetical protein
MAGSGPLSVRDLVEGLPRIDPASSIGDQFAALLALIARSGFAVVPLRNLRDGTAAKHDEQTQNGGEEPNPRGRPFKSHLYTG